MENFKKQEKVVKIDKYLIFDYLRGLNFNWNFLKLTLKV
jgi:hypothetical protein